MLGTRNERKYDADDMIVYAETPNDLTKNS